MNKIKVLLVDDNTQLVDMVKEYFSSHAVIEVSDVAYNGKECLSLLEFIDVVELLPTLFNFDI